MKNTKRKAFTLVELLVVIAIIGILFVVLISKVDFATEKSKASGVQTDFRSYQLAIETVARENAGLSTLVDDDASGEEKYAALEAALNKNLDPKLRVEIDENGKISTDAKDPWKEEYTGQYLAPDADGTVKDRGAIVMYCKGSNLKLGSTAEIVNGVVNVTIESGKETEGADDYSISTIYTYVNGYGEIKTTTKGFSNNIGDENTNQGNNTPANPADPDTPTEPEQGGEQEPVRLAAGLYDAEDNLVADWATLTKPIDEGGYGMDVETNYSFYTYKTTAESPYYVLTNNTDLASGTKLIISDDIENIGDYAFYSLTILTNVDFGSGVTSIGKSAFSRCSGLTGKLTIPDATTIIGNGAFSNCSGVTGFQFSNGVVSVGQGAFTNCTGLTSVDFSSCAVTLSGTGVFENCTGLVSVDLGSQISSIPTYTFNGCNGLTNIVIPDSVTDIRQWAFRNCSGLQSIAIGEGVTSIERDAFYGCSGLTGVYITDLAAWCNIDFLDGISNPLVFAKNLYLNNEPIANLVIPNEITEIKPRTFQNAKNIQTLTICNGITNIGENAFNSCSGMTSIHFSSVPLNVGNGAFAGCSGLTSIYITDLAAWCQINFESDWSNPLYYAKNLYLNNEPITNLVIPDEITEIKQYTFYNAQNITGTLTIPGRVTSIGNEAFYGCSGLTNLGLQSGVATVGSRAFYNCYGLTSVYIPDSITSIGRSAFSGCSRLTGVYITDLAAWCKIDFVDIHSNPTYCGNSSLSFYLNNTPITNLVIPDEITEIKQYAFSGFHIYTLTLHDNITNIGDYAFQSCSYLSEINFGTGLIAIGKHAFYYCNFVGDLIIPDGVTSIGDFAFYNCDGLTSITIPEKVTSIGQEAFKGCSKITTMTVKSTTMVPYSNSLLSNCTALTAIYVPADLVEQYKAADGWIDFADKIQAIPTT